jgi:hypothetical protein
MLPPTLFRTVRDRFADRIRAGRASLTPRTE